MFEELASYIETGMAGPGVALGFCFKALGNLMNLTVLEWGNR